MNEIQESIIKEIESQIENKTFDAGCILKTIISSVNNAPIETVREELIVRYLINVTEEWILPIKEFRKQFDNA